MRRLPHLLVMLALLPTAHPANASIITFAIEGVINDSPQGNPLESILPVGTDVDFVLKVDTTAPDMCPQPGVGFYQAPPASVSFGGNTYTSGSTFFEVQSLFGSCLGAPGVVARLIMDGAPAPFSFGTIGWAALGESLPTEPPSDGFFWFAYAGLTPTVFGEITGSEIVPEAVPEPSSLILALSGLAAIRWRRRR